MLISQPRNATVKFMLEHLEKAGCPLSPNKITCQECTGDIAGGFQSDGGIVMCSNHLSTPNHLASTLVHEMVHAFDQCRAKVNWGNCVHHACSEIRAATLSGDCNFGREVLLRRNFKWGKQFQSCVRRRAEISVSMNPQCSLLDSKRAVDHAFDTCYNDTAPFDRIP